MSGGGDIIVRDIQEQMTNAYATIPIHKIITNLYLKQIMFFVSVQQYWIITIWRKFKDVQIVHVFQTCQGIERDRE